MLGAGLAVVAGARVAGTGTLHPWLVTGGHSKINPAQSWVSPQRTTDIVPPAFDGIYHPKLQGLGNEVNTTVGLALKGIVQAF